MPAWPVLTDPDVQLSMEVICFFDSVCQELILRSVLSHLQAVKRSQASLGVAPSRVPVPCGRLLAISRSRDLFVATAQNNRGRCCGGGMLADAVSWRGACGTDLGSARKVKRRRRRKRRREGERERESERETERNTGNKHSNHLHDFGEHLRYTNPVVAV